MKNMLKKIAAMALCAVAVTGLGSGLSGITEASPFQPQFAQEDQQVPPPEEQHHHHHHHHQEPAPEQPAPEE